MTEFIKTVFGFKRGANHAPNDFSQFMESKSREKTKVIRQVLREANKEQLDLMKKYSQTKKN